MDLADARPLRGKQLVVFDLDGVLLDSRENMRLAWQQACAKVGIDVGFDRYFSEIGQPFPAIMTRLGLSTQSAAIESAYRIASMENIGALRFFSGVVDTLSLLEASGVKLGIVTSKDQMRTNAILAMMPVRFICVETPNDAVRGKPAPDHLLIAIARSRTDPADAIYVGDMDADHQAAVRAGIDYAHAGWGYGRRPIDGSPILDTIGDLLALVGKEKM